MDWPTFLLGAHSYVIADVAQASQEAQERNSRKFLVLLVILTVVWPKCYPPKAMLNPPVHDVYNMHKSKHVRVESNTI